MATYLENLTATRDSIAEALADLAANPKPMYSVDGQTISWIELFDSLSGQMEKVNKLINAAGPYSIQSSVF